MEYILSRIPSFCPFCGSRLVQEDCPRYGYGTEHAPMSGPTPLTGTGTH